MNFSKLIEDGIYTEENLNAEEKAFVKGLRQAFEVIDSVSYDYDDDGSVLGKLKSEIVEEFIEELKASLECEIDEFIVCIQDEREV